MRRVPYIPNSSLYRRHYGHGLPVFSGDLHQQGYGIGSFFASLFRKVMPLVSKTVVPILKNTAKSAGKSLLRTGTKVLSDVVLDNTNIKESIKRRGKEGFNEFIGKASEMKGGSYNRKRRGTKRLQISNPEKNRKRCKKDIFD